MYLFIRTVTPLNAASVPAALQFSAEVTAHMNRQYGLSMQAGIEMFGKGRLHWHYQSPTLDGMAEVNRKLMADAPYWALLEKNKHLWVPGSMKDRVISLMG